MNLKKRRSALSQPPIMFRVTRQQPTKKKVRQNPKKKEIDMAYHHQPLLAVAA